MDTRYDTQMLGDLLGDEFVQGMIKAVGIENEAPEVQAHLLDMLGQYIFEKTMLEVLKALPESERSAFNAYMGTGDVMGMRTFLGEHIPDIDRFLQRAASVAYETARSRAQEIANGAQ